MDSRKNRYFNAERTYSDIYLIAWSIILTGFFIFPYNTGRLINGFFNKIKNGTRLYINKVRRNPIYLIGIVVALFIFYKIYLFYASSVGLSIILS